MRWLMSRVEKRMTEQRGKGMSMAEYLDKLLIGAVAVIFAILSILLRDFTGKVEKLTTKVGELTEVMVAVSTKQVANDNDIRDLKVDFKKHLEEDREMAIQMNRKLSMSR